MDFSSFITNNLASLAGLVFLFIAIFKNEQLDKKVRIFHYVIIAAELVELVCYNIEDAASNWDHPTYLRIVMSAIGYFLRPFIAYMAARIVMPKKNKLWVEIVLLIPMVFVFVLAISGLFTFSTGFSHCAYWFDETNGFHRGPLGLILACGQLPYLALFFVFLMISQFIDKKNKLSISLMVVTYLVLATILEILGFTGVSRFAIILATIFIVYWEQTGELKKTIGVLQENQNLKEINEQLKQQISINQSIANIFMSIHCIDLDSNTFFEVKAVDRIKKFCDEFPSVSSALNAYPGYFAKPEYMAHVRDFMDAASLRDRLFDTSVISCDFLSVNDRWVRAMFIVVDRNENKECKHCLLAVQNVDREKKREQELNDAISYANTLARTDGLTGTLNRVAYEEKKTEIVNRFADNPNNTSVAFILFDVNGLKYINDHFGHDRGNLLLLDAARTIEKAFHKGLVYRIGGDEFVVIEDNPDDTLDASVGLFEDTMKNAKGVYGGGCYLSIAYGVAVSGVDRARNLKELIEIAESRMYKMKEEVKSDPNNAWMTR